MCKGVAEAALHFDEGYIYHALYVPSFNSRQHQFRREGQPVSECEHATARTGIWCSFREPLLQSSVGPDE